MGKPNDATIARDLYKRQLKMLEFYLHGRLKQLERIAKKSPAEAPLCEMAQGELRIILDQVLPDMMEVIP